MLRLIKYLKPYLLLIVISIVLLFVQANADLALPDYLSRIVNNGIQQGGIENAVPVAIRQTEMEKLVLFMSEQDKGTVLGNYSLVEKDSPDFDEYVKEYPILASEPVYVLNPIDQEEFERLDPIFGKALLVKSFIQQLMDDPTRAAAVAQQLGLDLTKLPAGADLFTVISKLPASQLSMITGTIDQEFASSTDKMIIQMAVGVVKAEYVALGMDMGIVQNDYILRVGGLMLLVTLLSGASTIAVSFLAAQTAAGFGRDVRKGVFTKVENFSSTEFDRF